MGQETNIRREIYTMRNLDAALSNAAPKETRIVATEILVVLCAFMDDDKTHSG